MESQSVCGKLHTVGVCGTQYGEMGLGREGGGGVCTRAHRIRHTTLFLPLPFFLQARSFCVQFFSPFSECMFSAVPANAFLPPACDYVCAAVEPVATAKAEPHVSSELAVTYAAPECVTPVQVVNKLLRLCGFAAPAPVLEDVTPAPVKKYVAPAKAVTCVTPAQQFLAAYSMVYTMAAVMTGVNLGVTTWGV